MCEFTTYVTDADGEEWEVRVEVTEYQPGTPEWKGPRMEDYDPGNPPDLSYDVYYSDGTRADDLIERLPVIEKIRLEEEVLKRAHEEWERFFAVQSLLRREVHPAIIHCDNCGCDWLDNGLNPIGCPYCELPREAELRDTQER